MSFSPIPDYSFHRVTEITPAFLIERGVTLLLLDLDNTLIPYGSHALEDDIKKWANGLRNSGIELFIVSNTHSERAKNFAEAMGVAFIKSARKPSAKGIHSALKQTGKTPKETALAGDQTFTDVLAANRAGIISIVVKPISLKNIILAIRYFFEIPFRKTCKNKMWENKK